MDWLFDHIGIFVFIAIVVASMLQKLKKAAGRQQARGAMDVDTSERTRRLQEEIRRKIAARSGRAPAGAQPASLPPVLAGGGDAPEAEPCSSNIFEELARQMAEARKSSEAQARARAEEQVRQRVQAGQQARDLVESRHLAEVQRALQEKQRAAEAAAAYGAADPKPAAMDRRLKLLADLREPSSLRRALVLREILGTPVGLR